MRGFHSFETKTPLVHTFGTEFLTKVNFLLFSKHVVTTALAGFDIFPWENQAGLRFLIVINGPFGLFVCW